MYKFLPFMTNDYSVGLFDEDTDDIYHSACGALTEAYEKFVLPANITSFISESKPIRVLDICYGIGYNTKALLNEFLKESSAESKLYIDAVDTNRFLIEISPFISSRISFFKRLYYKNKLIENIYSYKTAKKLIEKNKKSFSDYKFDEIINLIILKNLIKTFGEKFLSPETQKILTSKNNSIFFDDFLLFFIKNYANLEVELPLKQNLTTFVHNIYYKYISKRIKSKYKNNLFNKDLFSPSANITSRNLFKPDIDISFYTEDIRSFVKRMSESYDIIMLDGFTPSKCPCIWSLEFTERLYKLISDDGVLTTYNTSAPVRNALKQAGFFIGKIRNTENKTIGTIASKNKTKIQHPLSDKETGLLNTKAGIVYHDYNLSLDNDTILINRKEEVEKSDLLSSSKYLKQE